MTDQTMRVWQWLGGSAIEQVSRPLPKPGPHEILLRVRAVGICGTDVHIMRGIINVGQPPIALGHEVSGDVVACGDSVAHVKIGDRCVVDPGIACGYCAWCRTGQKTFCAHAQQIGMGTAGGWQEYILLPEQNCYPIPAHVGYIEASQAEPLFCVVGALDRAQIKSGEPVLVIGAGPTGLLFAYLAQQMTCVPTVLAGKRRLRLETARRWGIGQVIDVAQQPLEAALAGEEFPVVIEAAGTPQAIQQALAFCAPRGRVVLFGLGGEASVPLDTARVVLRDSSLLGAVDNPVIWPRIVNLLAGYMVPLRDLVTQVYPFDRLPEAVAWHITHPEETVKVVIEAQA